MSAGAERATAALLDARIDSFRFGGHAGETLRGIRLVVAPGTLTAIVGASGSGKTTLARVLAGMLPPPSPGGAPVAGADDDPDDDVLEAVLELCGRRVAFAPGHRVRIDPAGWAGRVGLLPQEARHFLSGARETVAEEIAFALENQGVPRPRMRERVRAVAVDLGLEGLLDRDVERLSGGQERLVALAALAVVDPAVLVLDEPLAGLDAEARGRVVAWAADRCARGRSVVHLTRREDEMTVRADDVRILAGGGLARSSPARAAEPCPPAAGGVVPSAATGASASHRPSTGGSARGLLALSGASLGYGDPGRARRVLRRPRRTGQPVLTGVDLTLHAGETVALLGPNGVGKTTLLKTAAGLLEPLAGTVRRTGRIGLLLQDSGDQLFERTVRREVGFGVDAPRAVSHVLDGLGLSDVAAEHPYELPGSVRRLVALATVLVKDPDVLLCDEPTVALDDAGLDLLRGVLAQRAGTGGAVLFSTHDEDFAAAAADRVIRLPGPGGRDPHDAAAA